MKKLFFAPVSSGVLYTNFEKSIVTGINSEFIPFYKSNEGVTRVWGIRDAKKAAFKKTSPGDIVCFYKEGDIVGYGEVALTRVDEQIANLLWGKFHNKQRNEIYLWPNIIILKNYNSCLIPFSRFIELGGYSEKFSVRGYLMLNEKGIDKIFALSKSIESFFETESLVDHMENANEK